MNETYDKYWGDDKNWHMGVYACPDDPRVIVPKRPKWAGKTLNFAHCKAAWSLFAATMAVAMLPTIIAFSFFGTSAPQRVEFWAGQAACIAVIVLLYYGFEFKVRSEN
jgi:hypothetical protein